MKKTKTTPKRKSSAAKKLVPATGMLLVSALMLTTSTYAWFTMSREVEVQNIKLVASVPEDLQISLGKLSTSDGSGQGYSTNEGYLVPSGANTNANNGNVEKPGTVSEYWASTVDVSKYYKLGTIIPASSTNGKAVFFTPDAAGVGKELKTGAKFYTAVAADATTGTADSTPTTTGKEYTQTYETTLHAITETDSWTPVLATAYNVTNDAGYYVDIPIWIRSAAKEDCYLAVDAYVTTNSTIDGDDLYLAARAVILDEAKTNTSKLIEIKKDNYSSFESIVDFMPTTNASGEAVATVTEEGGTLAANKVTYGTQTHYTGALLNGSETYKINKAAADANYGTATKLWVRVWLEGEDPNCWNDNAGQDFNICLKFTKDALTQNTGTVESPSEGANYPKANSFTSVANNVATSLKVGDTVSVTGSIKSANDPAQSVSIAMTYTYNGTTWERTDGSYPGVPIYVTGSNTPYANESEFITNYLASTYNTKASLSTTTTTITDEVTSP